MPRLRQIPIISAVTGVSGRVRRSTVHKSGERSAEEMGFASLYPSCGLIV